MAEFSSSTPRHSIFINNFMNAEEKLMASEERYHNLFSNIMDGFAF
jgi:hypothetical protein